MNELIRARLTPSRSNAPRATVDNSLEFSSTPSAPAPSAAPAESNASSDEYDDLFKNL